jgi:hypothetical protein
MKGKILPLKKKTLRSSEEIKIHALANEVQDLKDTVRRLSSVVYKLLKKLEQKR